MKDELFRYSGTDEPAPFAFGKEVSLVYEDMVRRSIPSYHTILETLPQLVEPFWAHGTKGFDVGASQGACSLALLPHMPKHYHWSAIDSSNAMCNRMHERFLQGQIEIFEGSALDYDYGFEEAGVIILNFILQFLPPDKREGLIQRLYQALAPGGGLILSEKILFNDQETDAFQVSQYEAFKRRMGYSQEEIELKKKALKDVMRLDSRETHLERLQKAGFRKVVPWLSHFNFTSIWVQK